MLGETAREVAARLVWLELNYFNSVVDGFYLLVISYPSYRSLADNVV